MAEPFLGEIRTVAFTYAPKGWAECQGTIMSIAQNTALFSLLGTQFGGNGITTFALPDFRGRVGVGQGSGPGLSPYSVGQEGGSEVETLQTAALAPHTHRFAGSGQLGSTNDPRIGVFAVPNVNTRQQYMYGTTPVNGLASAQMIGSAGGNQPHENRQPCLTVLFVIALSGIFPARS